MSKYEKGEALPLEEGLYNTIAPVLGTFLHEKLCLTPNMITTIALILGVLCIYQFRMENYGTSAALLVIRQVFDGMDGYVARKYDLKSKFGDKYDHVSDFIIQRIIFIMVYLKLLKYSPLCANIIMVLVILILNFKRVRNRCVNKHKRTPLCKNDEIRHRILVSTRFVSEFEIIVFFSLIIYSFKFK